MTTRQPQNLDEQERPVALRPAGHARPTISIVMPCLNEEQTVERCVRKALDWLERTRTPARCWSSTTARRTARRSWPRRRGRASCTRPRRGYGAALRRGFVEAHGDWLVMGDCDDTYEFSELGGLLAPLDEGPTCRSATASPAASRRAR